MTEPEASPAKEVWITGIGIVSSLGEGLDAHWDALNQQRINVDDKRFAPYIVHPLAPVSFDAQIPKKGDQRQMEAWQRIGTYAAGLALDSAGVKGNQEILGRMDMIVAAGGGEAEGQAEDEARGEAGPPWFALVHSSSPGVRAGSVRRRRNACSGSGAAGCPRRRR